MKTCSQCDYPAVDNKSRCIKHEALGNEASRRARLKKKSLGLCLQCNELATNRSRCAEHATIHREDYHRAVSSGHCPGCGIEQGVDSVYCGACKTINSTRRKKILESGRCPNHPAQPLKVRASRCILCTRNGFENALRSKYHLSLEEYAWMEYRQNRSCASCGQTEQLVVDHDHQTGAVRALLCGSCNKTLGHAKEKSHILQSVLRYLEMIRR